MILDNLNNKFIIINLSYIIYYNIQLIKYSNKIFKLQIKKLSFKFNSQKKI